MAHATCLLFLVLSYLSLLSLAGEVTEFNRRCPPFLCENLGYLGFPFSNQTHPECGLLIVNNCNTSRHQKIQLGKDGPEFFIGNIKQDNTLRLHDREREKLRNKRSCRSLRNVTLPTSAYMSFDPSTSNRSLFKCPLTPTNGSERQHKRFHLLCNDSSHSLVYNSSGFHPPNCSLVPLLVNKTRKGVEFINLYTGWFNIRVNVTIECYKCHWGGGQCQSNDEGNFHCLNARRGLETKGDENMGLNQGIGIGIGGLVALIVVLSIVIRRRRKKRKYASSKFRSRFVLSWKSDLEAGSVYLGVPIFSYSELADATNNFSHEKKLGDGGFGTVYYGKLRDGREVAVKRLYEHNYRRVEQFINEIEMLTRLHHKNLVLLYGCTSRNSQGLLLVYEFIPNGTVADHLHGDGANPCLLTWPIRMNIAIETASALAYLHASDIIHRDVKTNNILLDNNFCVKVADFGLSRLFPTNVTHVSTAPQGTPGYVDPEYHQCYQLTNKSDVYSFGVVLIELISSMPAVDISRHKNEVNLANLAINRILKCAVDELIDPCLGFHSDEEVKTMAYSVVELAFLCLQQDKEMRPSMDVVLEELKRIKNGECKLKEEDDDDKEVLKSMQQQPAPSPPHCDEAVLLKNIKLPSSPISVTENWVSNSTAPNVSN
ncbi:hypothetical protein JRO89_XS05G0256100 [Xanthoceras sorbifolium]|uniref:Protein kinase domain-containing protein n=1 Tax=Xanthoceras sorbifolium TaxID=99658 RepID=A0ABQ8I3J1_9ROSI|nr:hypothetical protein JRO89_XS05G0256100 [Xanthoceras sorbifolium]